MTNLEALSASVNYPIDEIKIQKILIDNKLDGSQEYTGPTQAFELATAALYVLLVTSANIAEGDLQISATDKSNYIYLANGIYNRYGMDSPLISKTNSFIQNRSDYW